MRFIVAFITGLFLLVNQAIAFDFCQSGVYNSGGPVTLDVNDPYYGFFCVNNVNNDPIATPTQATLPLTASANTVTVSNNSSIYVYGSTGVYLKDRGNAYVFSGAPRVLLNGWGMSRSIVYGGVVVNTMLSEAAQANLTNGYFVLASATDVSKISIHGGVYPQIGGQNVTLSCASELILYGYDVTWEIIPVGPTRSVFNETVYNTPNELRTNGVLRGKWYDGSSFIISVLLDKTTACNVPYSAIYATPESRTPRITVPAYVPSCGLFGIEVLPLFAYAIYRNRRKENHEV